MILRKPYGFLIKYFRLIHLIITGILGYLVLRVRNIYKFLLACISNSGNKYDAVKYIDYSIYIYIILGIMLFFVVFWLLRYKDKPRKIYIFSIIGYVIVGISLFVLYSYLGSIVNNLIDQKTIRFYRDILFIINLFQYYVIIFMFIRGLGFDIKKFNFSKDVQELNLTNEDNEEVLVNVEVDTTDVVRKIRKQKREFGYFYQEYKIYIVSILVIVLLFLGYLGYNYFNKELRVYKENESFGYIYNISIIDSYFDISKDNNYVIVKFSGSKSGRKDKFNVNQMILKVGKREYLADKNICHEFNYLGNCYKQQYITDVNSSYILVYKVDEFNYDETYIIYNESYQQRYKVKLELESY